MAEMLYPLIRASEHFAPNGIVRRRIRQTQERYIKNFGKPAPSQEIMSYYILAKAFPATAREHIDPRNRHPKQEPFKIYIYDKNGKGKDEPPYRVLYPERDKGFEFYNNYRSVRDEVFAKALGFIDNIFAPGTSPKATSIRMQLV
jgi:hypothetical protein